MSAIGGSGRTSRSWSCSRPLPPRLRNSRGVPPARVPDLHQSPSRHCSGLWGRRAASSRRWSARGSGARSCGKQAGDRRVDPFPGRGPIGGSGASRLHFPRADLLDSRKAGVRLSSWRGAPGGSGEGAEGPHVRDRRDRSRHGSSAVGIADRWSGAHQGHTLRAGRARRRRSPPGEAFDGEEEIEEEEEVEEETDEDEDGGETPGGEGGWGIG